MEETRDWQPIETAPWGKWLLLWWVPVGDNPYAETVVKGQVVAPDDLYGPDPKPTKYWDGGHAGPKVDEEGCKALDRITHWMPLPDRPASRPLPTPPNTTT